MHDESTEPEDVELIRRYVEEGDREAMGGLFRRYADVAYRTALRTLRNASEAEDAVQMAFVQAMRDAPRYRGGAGVRTWIMRMVMGTCKDQIKRAVRRRRREERANETEDDSVAAHEVTDTPAEPLETQAMKALEALPERYRLPVWMHHCEGMGFQEIAAALALPEGTVRSQASRGVEMLRGKLAEGDEAITVASVLTFLPHLGSEAVPASLLASVQEVIHGVGRFSEAALGGSAVLAEKIGASVGLKAALAAISVVTAGGVVGTAVYLSRTRAASGTAQPSSAVTNMAGGTVRSGRVSYAWDFNSPDVPTIFQPILGTWRHVPGGGPDGSGCMELESEEHTIVIEAPVDNLPVKVTYRHAAVVPILGTGHMLRTCWIEDTGLAQFFGLADIPAEPKPKEVGRWRRTEEFVTEDFIVSLTDGHLGSLTMIRRKPGSPLALFGRGKERIDDLRIESVDPREVPDVRVYLDAVNRIPEEKRVGTVMLPELKPGRLYKEVKVVFDRPKE